MRSERNNFTSERAQSWKICFLCGEMSGFFALPQTEFYQGLQVTHDWVASSRSFTKTNNGHHKKFLCPLKVSTWIAHQTGEWFERVEVNSFCFAGGFIVDRVLVYIIILLALSPFFIPWASMILLPSGVMLTGLLLPALYWMQFKSYRERRKYQLSRVKSAR